MRTVITAVLVEISVYNDDNKLVSRTQPQFLAAEAEITEPVLEWLTAQAAKRGA